jgi:prevent-host-death family protein
MVSVTLREMQHNLAACLRQVEQGEEVVIRRRQKPVARLVPLDPGAAGGSRTNWKALRQFRRDAWGDKPTPGTPSNVILDQMRGER